MKKTLNRIAALCLALILTLAGCRAQKSEEPAKPENDKQPAVLTVDDLPENTGATVTLENVYRHVLSFVEETTYVIPEGVNYDAENGLIRCMTKSYEEDEVSYRYGEIMTNGTVVEDMPVFAPEDCRISHPCMEDGAVIFLWNSVDTDEEEHLQLVRVDIGTKMMEFSDDFADSMKKNWANYINTLDLEEDADGNLYLLTDAELVVFSPDFTILARGKGSNEEAELLRAPDGTVWCKSRANGRIGIAPVNAEGKQGERRDLPVDFDQPQVECFHFLADGAVVFQDLVGVWVWHENEDPILLMDWMNSDCVAANSRLIFASDEETFIIADMDYGRAVDTALYVRADAADLASVSVLEFCTTIQLPAYIPAAIVDFNRNHPTVRIAVRDYFNDYGYTDAGAKLVQDILTGTYRPDVILGRMDGADLLWAEEHRTYLDLAPFLDEDDTVNRENVFGCVQRLLATEDGGMWAIPDEFSVNTLVAPKSLLPEGGWTLSEMLDFFESLPEDVIRMEGLTRENAASRLLGKNSYGVFFDRERGICSFDDPLYLRWLDFLLSLPANEAELKKTSEFERIAEKEDGEKYEYYWGGKVALSRISVRRYSAILSPTFEFGSRDWSFIGFPTADGRIGTETVCETVFVIMNWAEEAVAAWDLICSVVSDGNTTQDGNYGNHMRWMMPILKSQLDEDISYSDDYVYTFSFHGSAGMRWKGLYDHTPTDADLDHPGKLLEFLTEDGVRLVNFLDSIAGEAVSNALPDEVQAIVDEEISTLFGGVGNVEQCASKIQSRASIWLAEHE